MKIYCIVPLLWKMTLNLWLILTTYFVVIVFLLFVTFDTFYVFLGSKGPRRERDVFICTSQFI